MEAAPGPWSVAAGSPWCCSWSSCRGFSFSLGLGGMSSSHVSLHPAVQCAAQVLQGAEFTLTAVGKWWKVHAVGSSLTALVRAVAVSGALFSVVQLSLLPHFGYVEGMYCHCIKALTYPVQGALGSVPEWPPALTKAALPRGAFPHPYPWLFTCSGRAFPFPISRMDAHCITQWVGSALWCSV